MFTKILVPVDVSDIDVTQPGLDKAVDLAKASGAALRLIHVRSPVPYAMNEYIPAEYYETDEKASLKVLRDLAAKIDIPNNRVTVVSAFGSVYDEVLKEASEMGADLIVVGSHRPNWSTYLIGSNAHAIVRHALCSVLVVRLPNAPVQSL
jgi:nucleotide-binding universal stress UspA family protein